MKRTGKLFIIGIGSGIEKDITPRVKNALSQSDEIVGYKKYIIPILPIIQGKKIFSSGMGEEVDRCQLAVDRTKQGKKVALISSGDPGIYGMAGLALEIIGEDKTIDVEVIPGITSASLAAAVIGAPLMLDFAVVSLSDLLIPIQIILKRIKYAMEGDFVLVLYNPQSKKRKEPFSEAMNIIKKYRNPSIPVGIVWNAGRENEMSLVTTLGKAPYEKIDMNSVVIIGNSSTKIIGNWMVTPRGYKL